jgi:hypothetical protein
MYIDFIQSFSSNHWIKIDFRSKWILGFKILSCKFLSFLFMDRIIKGCHQDLNLLCTRIFVIHHFIFCEKCSPLECFHPNATRGVIPRFYNFKGERLRNDYIKLCQPRTYMAMQKRAWMSSFLLKKFLAFFN